MTQILSLQSSAASFWKRTDGRHEAQFRMQHHLRHATYDYAASKAGVSLAGLDLTGEIGGDWLFRHAARHSTYRSLIGGKGASPTTGLSSLDWRDASSVQSWMQFHERLHADLDAYFGLKS